MIRINVEQGSNEWKELRKSKIGASDTPVIMGVSPWKTPLQLWEEKLGLREEPQMTDAMKFGKVQEHVVLMAYNDKHNEDLEPAVVISSTFDWMIASFDGLKPDGSKAVEIKCANYHDHKLAINGIVPKKYYPQLQKQMYVGELQEITYVSHHNNENIYLIVKRDEDYIESIIEKEIEFINCMKNFSPPKMDDDDYQERNDQEWLRLVEEWEFANESLQMYQDLESLARERLLSAAGGKNVKGGGIKVACFERKGSIDYKSIPELKDVDLDKYRKESTKYWRIS